MTEQLQPSHEERVIATLAHAGGVMNIINMAGLFGAALIWANQHNGSPYVRTHAAQAVAYQLVTLLIGMLLLLAWGGCLGFALLPMILRPDLYEHSWPALFWLVMLLGIAPLGFAVLSAGYALFGAWCAYRNVPFRYVLVHRLVRAAEVATPPPPVNPAAPVVG